MENSLENILYQIVETRYVNKAVSVYRIYPQGKNLQKCIKVMRGMYKYEGFFVKKREESIEFYTNTSEHWKVRLEIVESHIDDTEMYKELAEFIHKQRTKNDQDRIAKGANVDKIYMRAKSLEEKLAYGDSESNEDTYGDSGSDYEDSETVFTEKDDDICT